jgi:SnoaL-like domain
MSLPHILTSLTEREAIADALYRALLGLDNNDISLFNSAWSGPDAVLDLSGTVYNLDAIRTHFFEFVGPMDTTHIISNARVDVKDGASTSSLTATTLTQHCPPGRGTEPDSPKFLTGSTHFLDLVKDKSNGSWKIEKWIMKTIWRQGDNSVMQRPG